MDGIEKNKSYINHANQVNMPIFALKQIVGSRLNCLNDEVVLKFTHNLCFKQK